MFKKFTFQYGSTLISEYEKLIDRLYNLHSNMVLL